MLHAVCFALVLPIGPVPANAQPQARKVVVREQSRCTWCGRTALGKPDAAAIALAEQAQTAVLLRIAGAAPAIIRGSALRSSAKTLFVVSSERPGLPNRDSAAPSFKLVGSLRDVEDEAARLPEDVYYVRFDDVRAAVQKGSPVVAFRYSWGVMNAREVQDRRAGLPPSQKTLFGGSFVIWAQREGADLVLYDGKTKIIF